MNEPFAPRVLIIEDSDDLGRLWHRLFSAKGYRPTVCSSAMAGLALVASGEDFDACVSDYFLSDMNGILLAENLRAVCPDLPFVLVTGAREATIRLRAEEFPKTAFLNKPIEFSLLEEKVRELIELKTPSVRGVESAMANVSY